MNRAKQKPNSTMFELIMPTSFLDVLAALVLVFAASASSAGRFPLPFFQTPKTTSAEAVSKRPGNHLELLADGAIVYQGQPVKLRGLGKKLAAEPDQTKPILVSLATNKSGNGALQTWIELVIELNESKQWSRVQLLKKAQPRSLPGATNQ